MVQLSPELSFMIASHQSSACLYLVTLQASGGDHDPWSNLSQSYHGRTLRCANLRLVTLQTAGGDHVPWSNLAQNYHRRTLGWCRSALFDCERLEEIMTHGPT